jgi:8-oxo-dGTP pyrophosphatase MutT (NUDIX family)
MTASVVADPDPGPDPADAAVPAGSAGSAGSAEPARSAASAPSAASAGSAAPAVADAAGVTGARPAASGASASGLVLPDWWEPLARRAASVREADFGMLANRRFWRSDQWPTPRAERQAAVLILLGEQPETGPDVLIMQRAATLRDHAGQPAFPGGSADPGDADAEATALREAAEEVGLDPATTTTVALLPRLWIPVSGFAVTPVLSWWHAPHPVHPASPREVAGVARVPIAELVDPDNRVRVRHRSGVTGPAFAVRGMLIWGFTAGVLDTLLDLGGWSRPWDHDRFVDLPDQSR